MLANFQLHDIGQIVIQHPINHFWRNAICALKIPFVASRSVLIKDGIQTFCHYGIGIFLKIFGNQILHNESCSVLASKLSPRSNRAGLTVCIGNDDILPSSKGREDGGLLRISNQLFFFIGILVIYKSAKKLITKIITAYKNSITILFNLSFCPCSLATRRRRNCNSNARHVGLLICHIITLYYENVLFLFDCQ